jgi:hypothetical protein
MLRIACMCALTAGLAVAPEIALSQAVSVDRDHEWCQDDHGWDSDHDRYCEVREITLDGSRDVIRVDAEPNGGIAVHGWDKRTILVRAKVVANARSSQVAERIAQEVEIRTSGTIRADGPRTRKREWFSVSYEIFAPRESNVDLETQNGGIQVVDLEGRVRFETLNGGVELASLAGDVRGRTTNGGVSIDLRGDRWDGRGLDVETVNGGVSIHVPDNYSAELETGTVNGHIEINFPVLIEGRFDRKLTATLGDGGKLIRAVTTNGGVVVTRG